MVKTFELTTSDFPAAVDMTPIVRVRFPARRYSFDGDGNLVIRQHKQRRTEPMAPANTDHAQEQSTPEGSEGSVTTNVSTREYLTEAIATSLRTTSLPSAAVEPMARTLAALSGDLTTFDRAAEAQLETIEMPSPAVRSLLLEAIRSLARVANLTNASPTVMEAASDGSALRALPVNSRPFSSSSGNGFTTWQIAVQEESIPHPPTNLKCSTGHLFIHRNPETKMQTCWMYGKSGNWEVVTEGAEHPFIPDRILHFRPGHSGEPSWNTRATMMTTRARNEKRATPGPLM
ncbi:uncharacterized protein STEHIDRAFT_159195 [Stereum hirsutum FP-91666 SS1]|uniref:uncharacterized protein n=1 Tax=Stereum hirsutum (strain FP-91666) TaxID=721885 RepID=UPI000444930B|nr:uncharacterized protein STEHIDRAFT_159195 [Stereum hirsutum FP-91666 SS1]EIM84528.1 hypothetical protein STEHIDRAFT_159195 [Stereum hirsutum FP-91666 SS1]